MVPSRYLGGHMLRWLMVVSVLGALCTFAGCSSNSSPCPAPTGLYVFRYTETSGNCGAVPNSTGRFPPDRTGGFDTTTMAGCTGGWSAADGNMCTYNISVVCMCGCASNGLSVSGSLHNAGTDQWDGTVNVTSDALSSLCSSTYSVTVSRT